MFFRWDWLRPVLTAPVVPTLGPVHPHALTVDLFEDTLTAAAYDRYFLHYDKDRRWSMEKNEVVLPRDVVHERDQTLIPTLTRRGRGVVKVYAYGHRGDILDQAAELAAKLAALHGVVGARVVRPLGPETVPRGVRIQLQDFTARSCPRPAGPVDVLSAWPDAVQSTFAVFAEAMSADGLAFLHSQMQAGRGGPVLTAVDKNRVVGAIGPMEIHPDAIGARQLMPQYFAVLPEMRGRGLGRLLWRAAMHWGQARGAAYQVLQTEVGGPSDRLCRAEGLTTLGFTHTVAV
ncbi:GNAT family N-acetyltransferase [Streptomyces beijiangensis]|uniref:GNAT family N-acetyltransferase n=1 Tax=Streptomyces beijiangensis TaxID=163361 RepID=A0A939F5I4_9ACTN|nr:GNAT family N-acetyltransferase [Streptomyces beijiangensis]MBO0512437.1 GNAT family N-acetyltransferase [Streptomyces beijiangensis]